MPQGNPRQYYDLARDRQMARQQQGLAAPPRAGGFNVGNFTGQAGGNVTQGDTSITTNSDLGAYQTAVQAMADAYGNQLGFLGDTYRTQGGVEQQRLASDAQTGVAGIQGQAGRDIAGIEGGTQRYLADADQATQLGVSGDRLAGTRHVADQGLAGIESQTGASKFGSVADLIAALEASRVAAIDPNNRQLRFNTVFGSGGDDPDDPSSGGSFLSALLGQLVGDAGPQFGEEGMSLSAPGLDADEAVARAQADNAAQEAAALNQPEFAGAAPQTGPASQRAGLNRAMADTQAMTDIYPAYEQANLDNNVAIIDALNRTRQAKAQAASPYLQFLTSFA